MMERHALPVAAIRVPSKRARTLEPEKVAAIAEDWMERGQQTPIRCRPDPKEPGAFILVEGYHRLEAARALGEETILGFLVRAQLH